jgi:hypothetical protein
MKLCGFDVIAEGRKRAPAAGGDRSSEAIAPTSCEGMA